MTTLRLLRRRRFLPLFCTQLLNAFNDNLYKTAMVLFVVYAVYSDPETETVFSAIATGLFIGPFILVSAIAGQLADMRDKAKIIRTVKLCEIGIMTIGAAGLFLAWQDTLVHSVAVPLMLFALFLAGLQSTFLGPIKYAISICARPRCSLAPAWSRRAPMSRYCSARSSQAGFRWRRRWWRSS